MKRLLLAALLTTCAPAHANSVERTTIADYWGPALADGRLTVEFDGLRVVGDEVVERWVARQDVPVPCLAIEDVLNLVAPARGFVLYGPPVQYVDDAVGPGMLFVIGTADTRYSEGWVAMGPTACLRTFVVVVAGEAL